MFHELSNLLCVQTSLLYGPLVVFLYKSKAHGRVRLNCQWDSGAIIGHTSNGAGEEEREGDAILKRESKRVGLGGVNGGNKDDESGYALSA